MAELSVVIVGEDALVRHGLAALLSGLEDVRVVGLLAPAESEAALGLGAAVTLWDVGRAPTTPPEGPPLVALVHDAERAAELLADGVRGVLSRDIEPARLHAAIRAVEAGLVVVDPSFVEAIPGARMNEDDDTLTPREREILPYIARGLSNGAIAKRLHISEHTIRFHVKSLLAKLGAGTRTDAVVRAARLGLMTL